MHDFPKKLSLIMGVLLLLQALPQSAEAKQAIKAQPVRAMTPIYMENDTNFQDVSLQSASVPRVKSTPLLTGDALSGSVSHAGQDRVRFFAPTNMRIPRVGSTPETNRSDYVATNPIWIVTFYLE